MSYLLIGAAVLVVLYFGWKLTSRNAYESAEYVVLETDGPIELREYPDLMLVSTEMQSRQGNDGSFGRLFRYISGGNEDKQKVAMTTPVFMEPANSERDGQMGFVIPKDIAAGRVPVPTNDQVQLTERKGGKFAVIRFSGRQDQSTSDKQRQKLESWIEGKGFKKIGAAEFAGYDPPWTPGVLRRNEILIRVDDRE